MGVRLQDVARRAGVSPSAASAALRPVRTSNVRLSAETRQRIMTAARELGYRANPLARGLRGQSTRTIGVAWWLGSPPGREFMARRLTQMLQRRGYATFLTDSFASTDHVLEALANFAMRGVDGVIVEGGPDIAGDRLVRERLHAFRAAVLVQSQASGTSPEPIPEADVVVHDRYAAIQATVEHLVATGRRRPLMLIARHAREGKAEAFRARLAHHRLPSGPDAVIEVDEHDAENLGRLACQTLDARATADGGVTFDALITSSDEFAVAAMAWLQEQGLRVPGDVAVVGFNDSHVAGYLNPPLASVDRREPDLIQRIETRLFERLDHPDAAPAVDHLPMRFVWRRSAGGEGDCSQTYNS